MALDLPQQVVDAAGEGERGLDQARHVQRLAEQAAHHPAQAPEAAPAGRKLYAVVPGLRPDAGYAGGGRRRESFAPGRQIAHQSLDRPRPLRAQLRAVAGGERRLPPGGFVDFVRQQRQGAAQERPHGLCKCPRHLLAGCCVTCVQQAAGLAEAAPEIALPGGHIAAKDGQLQQRVLAAHGAAIDRQFQVIDVGRQQPAGQRGQAAAKRRAAIVDQHVQVQQALAVVRAAKVRAVEQHRRHGVPVARAQRLRQCLGTRRGRRVDQAVDGLTQGVSGRAAHGRRNSNSGPALIASSLPEGGK